MGDKNLYEKILGIKRPWRVTRVSVQLPEQRVLVTLENPGTRLPCPRCGVPCHRYDERLRRWRHLDTCQLQTILEAAVPRIDCREHGVLQVDVPWAERGSRFTALFEALVIDWLGEGTISGVRRLLGLSWGQVDRTMARAVERGLARRKLTLPPHLGVDETSFQKRHEYVTVISDRKGDVLEVTDGRGREALESFLGAFPEPEREAVESVAMDMHRPYISAVEAQIPEAFRKIAFDKFHVAQHLGDAVDQVRRKENKAQRMEGESSLKGTKYLWLRKPSELEVRERRQLADLRRSALKTARAWAIRQLGMDIWRFKLRANAYRAWKAWYSWAIRSRLEPIKRVARMTKRHLTGIMNAVAMQVTNAKAEGLNAIIQRIKYNARGFRSRARFRIVILFHLGGLALYPDSLSITHTR